MRIGVRALLILSLLSIAIPARAQVRGSASTGDPLRAIARWTNDYRRLGAALDPATDRLLAPALEALKFKFDALEADETQALTAVCDLSSIASGKSAEDIAKGRYVADGRESAIRDAAQKVLRSALDAPMGEDRGAWLAKQVLAGGADQPIPRRIAVGEALIGRHWDSTLLALLTAAAAPERGLREAAVAALSGWRSDAVDRYLAQLTLRALSEDDFLSTDALVKHFESRALAPENPAAIAVSAALAKAAISSDWRAAVRRIPLSRILPNELAMPKLVEALSLWSARGAAGASSRRVEALLVQELERRSGQHIGMSADRWARWWMVTRAKDPKAAGRNEAGAPPEERTEATFFGLRPWTDRVVFVIDRSGSMAEGFSTGGWSRYTEALRQLKKLLTQLGPRTKFNLILFSDEAHAWSSELKSANTSMIDAAVLWARNSPPQGGTFLRPGIARALEIDPRDGRPDLEKLEADTIIVLCDGGTAEGAGWVVPLLRAVREPTGIQFHCVQIGGSGDGTLEALAKESGGKFVRVDT